MEDAEPTKNDRRIFKVLRDHCDTPRILFSTEDPLVLERDGERKYVLLFSTKFYTYMIKLKGFKLYAVWTNRQLSVTAELSKVTLTSLDARAISVSATPKSYKETTDAALNEFSTVTLETETAAAAEEIEEHIMYIVESAQRTAALLAQQEMGVNSASNRAAGKEEDDDDDVHSAASSDSDDGNDVSRGSVSLTLAAAAARGVALQGDAAKKKKGGEGVSSMAPSRYIAITSLVDGEFADYTTLKNAYMRHEEEALLRDLGVFIKENEGQVEALCEHHYPALIHAAQQCVDISERDAELVGEELSGATTLVRTAVVNMKKVTSNLLLSRNTRDNLQQVRGLLSKAIAVAEYLETAESQTERQQLVGAVTTLRELIRLAAPLSEYAIGEYVLHVRVPALTQDVFSYAVQHLNNWLRVLRDKARPIGQATMDWKGAMASGYLSSHIEMAETGEQWWLKEEFMPAQLNPAPFAEADAITAVSNGAGIQAVFLELHREEYLDKYYAEGRWQQARADLLEVSIVLTDLTPAEVLAKFKQYCATALGFILIEDIVYCATSPHLRSRAEIIQLWAVLSNKVTEHALNVLRVLLADPSKTDEAVEEVQVLQSLIRCAADNVKCVEVNNLPLSRAMEACSDELISSWLQQACVECMQLISSDSFNPATARDAKEFEEKVTRFNFQRCVSLELSIPTAYTSGVVTLPYSPVVPQAGDCVLSFLARCYSAIITDPSTVVMQSELNNVDEMLLKYLTLLFRSMAESMFGQLMTLGSRAVLQLAVFVTSCSMMPVLVSCAEQQYMLHWQCQYEREKTQAMGTPRLMADCAKFFSKSLQQGIERLLAAFMGEVEDRLKNVDHVSFWKAQVEGQRQGKKVEGDNFMSCMEYTLSMIPKLSALLQSAVVRSVVGTVITRAGMLMQSSVGTAISNAYRGGARDFQLWRDCIDEFEKQCNNGVPMWQRRLGELLPGISAATRFPLNGTVTAQEVRQSLAPNEEAYNTEKANQPQILAGIEGASKAMAKGFQVVGKGVAATANVFKKDQQ
jgi:exocyst complex component 6